LFGVDVVDLDSGFKYLGFYMKLNNYGIRDYKWLIQKIEKKLANWSLEWLTLGGRLILA